MILIVNVLYNYCLLIILNIQGLTNLHIRDAKHLITYVDQKTRGCAKALDKQELMRLFVPAFRGDGIVPRHSLIGRILLLIKGEPQRFAFEQRVTAAIGQALRTLAADATAISEISVSTRFALRRLVPLSEETTKESKDVTTEDHDTEAFDKMKKERLAGQAGHQAAIRRLSLLNHTTALSLPAGQELKTLQSLFEASSTLTSENLDFLTRYLNANPRYKGAAFDSRLVLLKERMAYTAAIRERFFVAGVPLSGAAMDAKRKEVAAEMARDAVSGKGWMYCSGFGKKRNSLAALAALVKLAPKDPLGMLPLDLNGLPFSADDLKDFSNQPSIEKIVAELLKQQFTTFEEKFLGEDSQFLSALESYQTLFADDSRHLPVRMTDKMPQMLVSQVEAWLKQGLLGGAMEFVSDGEFRELMLEISTKARDMHDPAKRQEHYNTCVDKFVEKIIKNIPGADGAALNESLMQLMRAGQQFLPETLLTATGLDAVFSSGELWITCDKQSNGRYTVSVFANGQALSNHAKVNELTEWPLKLYDVKAENLNEDFFKRVLDFDIDPLCNPDRFVSPKDFYNGALAYLEGTKRESGKGSHRPISPHPATEYSLAVNFLMKEEVTLDFLEYQMRKEALIAFCRPYMRGEGPEPKDFVLDDSTNEAGDAVMQAVDYLLVQARTLKQTSDVRALEAARDQVEMAIKKHKPIEVAPTSVNHFQLSPELVSYFNQALAASGISVETLKFAKENLVWAFGDEIGTLVDMVADQMPSLPKPEISKKSELLNKLTVSNAVDYVAAIYPSVAADAATIAAIPNLLRPGKTETTPVKKSPRGVLGTLFLNVYIRTVLTVIIYAIKISRVVSNFSLPSVTLLLKPLIYDSIMALLPQVVKNWLASAIAAITRQFAAITTHMILRTLLSAEDAKKFKALITACQVPVQQFAKTLTGQHQVSYTANAPIVLPTVSRSVTFELRRATCHFAEFNQNTSVNAGPAMQLAAMSLSAPLGDDILKTLDKWNQDLRAISIEGDPKQSISLYQRHIYIQHQCRRLQIPQRGVETCWDQIPVEDIPLCMQKLGQFAEHIQSLTNTKYQFSAQEKAEFGKRNVYQYYILCIMDYLARRCPESYLDGYEVDAYPLLDFISSPAQQSFDHPDLVEKFSQTCRYFFPDIDISKPLDKQAIEKRQSKTLFRNKVDFTGTPGNLELCNEMDESLGTALDKLHSRHVRYSITNLNNRDITWEVFLSPNTDYSIAECAFFRQILDRPGVQERIQQMNLGFELSRATLINLIGIESTLIRKENAIVSPVIAYLQMQTLRSNENSEFIQSDQEIETQHFRYGIGWDEKLNSFLETRVSPLEPLLAPLGNQLGRVVSAVSSKVGSVFSEVVNVLPSPFESLSSTLFSPAPLQASIIANTRFSSKLDRSECKWIARKAQVSMISCEQSGRVMRAIAHFREHMTDVIGDFRSPSDNRNYDKHAWRVWEKNTRGFVKRGCIGHVANPDLWSSLFHPVALKQQLEDSPQSMVAIGTFVRELLEKAIENGYDSRDYFFFAVMLGIKLQAFCKQWAPAHLHAMPDLKMFIEKWGKAEDSASKATQIVLLALLDDAQPDAASADRKKNACLQLCRGIFAKGWSDFSNRQAARESRLNLMRLFDERVWLWTPEIKSYLSDAAFRTELINQLLIDRGLESSDLTNKQWDQEADSYVYTYADWKLDLLSGTFSHANDDTAFDAYTIRRVAQSDAGIDPQDLQICADGKWRTRNGEYHVYIVYKPKPPEYGLRDASGCLIAMSAKPVQLIKAIRILRHINNKVFHPMPSQAVADFGAISQNIVQMMGLNADLSVVRMWIEGLPTDKRREEYEAYVVLSNGEEKLVRLKTSERQPTQIVMETTIAPDATMNRVDAGLFRSSLAPLSRFCPLAQTTCWAATGTTHLARIRFEPYNLEFAVEGEGNTLQAVNQDLVAGYKISLSQSHKALRSFPSYLLVDNGSQQKVLIPDGQLEQAAVWRYVSKLGVVSDALRGVLTETVKTAKLHVYEIDKKGRLTSDNPSSMVHLVMLYLINGDEQRASEVCTEIEQIGRRQALPAGIAQQLLPFALTPPGMKSAINIRRRLLAAVEENFWVRQRKQSDKPEVDTKKEDVLLTLMAMMDLKMSSGETDPRFKIPDEAAWFLFKSILRRSKRMLVQQVDLGRDSWVNQLENRVKGAIDWDTIVEKIALPCDPDLLARYRYLKNKYGTEDSLLQKAFGAGVDFATAGSRLSGVPNVHVSATALQQIVMPPAIANFLSPSIRDEVVSLGWGAYNKWQGTDESTLDLPDLYLAMRHGQATMQTPAVELMPLSKHSITAHFLHYYKIAVGERGAELQKKLQKLLTLSTGGWDARTKLLIRYLQAIAAHPIVFKKSQDLESFLEDVPSHIDKDLGMAVQRERFKRFFKSLSYKINGMESAYQATSLLVKSALWITASPHVAQCNIANMLSPVQSLNGAFSMMGTSAVGLCVRGYNALTQSAPAVAASESKKRVYHDGNYGSLAEVDTPFNALLDQMFELVFAEGEPDGETALTGTADVASFDHPKISQSLQDYHARKGAKRKGLKYLGEEGLWQVYFTISGYADMVKIKLKQERHSLLYSLNDGSTRNVTMEDLQRFFVKGDISELPITTLSKDSLQNLDRLLMKYLMCSIRYKQLKRLCVMIESLEKCDPETQSQDFESKVEALADGLRARRTWRVDDIPPKLARLFVMFETGGNTMLWQHQVDKFKEQLLGHKGEGIIELLMSLGKTFFYIPTLDAFDADGTKLVVNIWPSAMVETNVRQISAQSRRIYDQVVNALHFSRTLGLSAENFEAIRVLYLRALENGETLNMTKQDCQGSELLFLDHLFAHHTSSEGGHMEAAEALQKLQRMTRSCGKVIGDEAHELFNEREELNYPIGESVAIPRRYYDVMEACFRKLADHEDWMEHIYRNELGDIPADYREKLAEEMSAHPSFAITDAKTKAEFISFVLGTCPAIPAWISASPQYSEISLVKGILTKLLPLCIGETVAVDFGRSRANDDCDVAKPYEGNDSPIEQALIKQPFEAMCKTFMTFLHSNLNRKQVIKLLAALCKNAEAEAKKLRGIRDDDKTRSAEEIQKEIDRHLPNTRSYLFFQRAFPDMGLNLKEALEMLKGSQGKGPNALLETIRTNHACLFKYIRLFVRDQVRYWKQSFRSDAQNFASMFRYRMFDTGTPYNDGTYPTHMKMLWEEGTLGEAITILQKKCPADGVHILKAKQPREILDHVLHQYFKPGSSFSSIIDGGPQFKGLSNRDVADKMRVYVAAHRLDIKAIDFFERDASGRDLMMTWEIGDGKEPVPYDRCSLPVANRLAYFDQRHGFAANIPQRPDGKGLILVGQKHVLYRLLQEAFRMRNIKHFKQLIDTKDNGGQQVEFAMTEETARAIHGKPSAPTVNQLVLFAQRNEDDLVANKNYEAYKQKVFNVIRNYAMHRLVWEEDKTEMGRLAKAFSHILISSVEDDPKVLFGLLEKERPIGEALKMIRESAFKMIAKCSDVDECDRQVIRQELEKIPVPPMPATAIMLTDGVTIQCDRTGDFQKNNTVEQSIDTEQDNENNNEQELDNEQNTVTVSDLQVSAQSASFFDERPWAGIFDPRALPASSCSGMVSKVSSLLAVCRQKSLRTIAGAFDGRLWFSHNFLPSDNKWFSTKTAPEIGTWGQRPLFDVLVHLKEHQDASGRVIRYEILSMGSLSQRDSTVWKEKLRAGGRSLSDVKAVVYDVSNRVIVGGDRGVDQSILSANADFMKLVIQMKFLNGDVQYDMAQQDLMEAWLKQHDVKEFVDAFTVIYDRRKVTGRFAGSAIAHAFDNAAGD